MLEKLDRESCRRRTSSCPNCAPEKCLRRRQCVCGRICDNKTDPADQVAELPNQEGHAVDMRSRGHSPTLLHSTPSLLHVLFHCNA
ncbi:hypothetical protein SRHO_G00293160 [Serrasalmus rhombeus]